MEGQAAVFVLNADPRTVGRVPGAPAGPSAYNLLCVPPSLAVSTQRTLWGSQVLRQSGAE